MSDRSTIRIFVSSPSDVRPERLIAERVIKRLAREFAYRFDVQPVLWEREPLLATSDFQTLITPPSQTDIVIVILWSRLGVVLPAPTVGRLSGRPVTGTEYEFEDAFAGFREKELPHLLLYRKQAEIIVKLGDRAQVEEQQRQSELVEDFMMRWTRDAEGRAFTAAHWPFVDGAQFEAMVEDHLRALLHKRATGGSVGGPATPTVRWHQGSPFRGLQSFEPEHEQIFFGRTRARNELREVMNRQSARGEAFVLVVGASGSGKSSLVKAGLLPDLRLPGMLARVGLVRAAITRPAAAADPLEALAGAVLEALPELAADPLGYDARRLVELGVAAPDQAVHAIRQGLSAAGRGAGLTRHAEARLLLVIDQLEELLTVEQVSDERRQSYVAALQALARSGLVSIVATMRSDFFARLDRLPSLARLAVGEATYFVTPPDGGELGQIVRQPAREAGLTFEVDPKTGEGLDDLILKAAAASAGSLPLLEYLLDQLFARRSESGMLTFSAYRALGGLEGAIGARAEETLAALPSEVQDALPSVLRALVTVGEGAEAHATARYAARDRYAENSPQGRLIDALLAPGSRLLVADGGTIRVAHEALLTHWERARRQIAEDRSDLQLRARLEQAAALWRAATGKDRESLLLGEGLPLSQAEDLMRRRREEIESDLAEFVEASAHHASHRRRRGVRRLIYVSVVLGVLALVATSGMLAAYIAVQTAQSDFERAEKNLTWSLKMVNSVIDELTDESVPLDKIQSLIGIVETSLNAIDETGLEEQVSSLRTRMHLSVVPPLLKNFAVEDAQRYADEAMSATTELASRNPENQVYRSWRFIAHANVGRVRAHLGEWPEAIEAWKTARESAEAELAITLTSEWQTRKVTALQELSRAFLGDGRTAEAESILNDAIELQKKAVAVDDPEKTEKRERLARLYEDRGSMLIARGDVAAGIASLEEAANHLHPNKDEHPGPFNGFELARMLDKIARIACERDDMLERCEAVLDEAKEYLGFAVGYGRRHFPDLDDVEASIRTNEERLKTRKP